jgi:hypothetical protein
MHRTITITVPAGAADDLARALQALPGVVGLALHRGASLKPPGDELVVQSLSREADEVLRLARSAAGDGPLTVVTSEAASLTDRSAQGEIDRDRDEAAWEEMESQLLQKGRATPNFVALTALGGAVAVAGLASDPVPQAVAMVAASVIAPGFEPIAMVPLGAVLGRGRLIRAGFLAALVGYAAVALAAALALWALVAAGAVTAEQFTENPQVRRLAAAPLEDLVVSAGGALAGVILVSSFRHDALAGALMAMMLVPAAAMVGGALAMNRPDLAVGGVQRAGIDALLVLGAGVLVFGVKQLAVHRRRSLRRP